MLSRPSVCTTLPSILQFGRCLDRRIRRGDNGTSVNNTASLAGHCRPRSLAHTIP